MDDLKDKLFEIKVEHERYFYEIEEGPYYMQRAIVDAFKKALQETSRVVETVHPIYEHFNALNATSKEQMHNLVREFEKVAACYDEQIALVKGRNLELDTLKTTKITPLATEVTKREANGTFNRDRGLKGIRRDYLDTYNNLTHRIHEAETEIKRLREAKAEYNAREPLHQFTQPGQDISPAAFALNPKIDTLSGDLQRLLRERAPYADMIEECTKQAATQTYDDDDALQYKIKQAKGFPAAIERLCKQNEGCCEELQRTRDTKVHDIVSAANKLVTTGFFVSSFAPVGKDALAIALVGLTEASLNVCDKLVNGRLKDDGQLIASNLEKAYTVGGQVKMPDTVKSVYERMNTTLSGLRQGQDDKHWMGEDFPEWFVERREKYAREKSLPVGFSGVFR